MKQSYSEKIDIFTHILTDKYRRALYKKVQRPLHLQSRGNLEEFLTITPALYDIELRLSIMDKFEGLKQVLTLTIPPLELVVSPRDAVELAELANDETAELIAKYPDRFIAGVACLPMNDIDAALRETERAIEVLNMKGVQVFTPCDGKALDSPEFLPLYEMMAKYDLPIWIHPIRGRDVPDYKDESYSKYRMFIVFGWPYETTVAMARLVLSGVLERYPSLKIITHHCGAMVPFFEQRSGWALQRVLIDKQYEQYEEDTVSLSRLPIEYFKMFYGDTALAGSTPGLMCGHAFFGAEHILFGTDMPYGYAEQMVARVIASVERMAIPDSEKYQIFAGNARRLLGI